MERPVVIIPPTIKPLPTEDEIAVAQLFSQHFKTTVEFLIPGKGYKQKTPDFTAGGLLWEIKIPTGSSTRSTIEKQMQKALRQSSNVIVDARKTKIADSVILKQLYAIARIRKRVSRIILLDKDGAFQYVYKRK